MNRKKENAVDMILGIISAIAAVVFGLLLKYIGGVA